MTRNNRETIREVLLRTSRLFEEEGIRAPLYNAEMILQDVLGVDKTGMLLRFDEPFPETCKEELAWFVQLRESHVPLQHILGYQEFYGRKFSVSYDVLIPRPETELLVEQVLKQRPHFQAPGRGPLLVDIGTGSGAIAVTLAAEWPELRVIAIDLSPDALEMARKNAREHGVEERITFMLGDLYLPLIERGLRPDIVVSNPPYIPSADCEELDAEVRDFEPRLALDGGEDGLDPYRRITGALPQLWPIEGPAFVAFEVGIHQDRDVEQMIADSVPGVETGILPDLQGIGRVIWGLRTSL
ncbi:peptide chain release factor N(5)-glutamine methyltransferase [Tumebacillus sp. DT12]|uniref:Release factor glutamine methyltransferase n=1 Tax=Tumebacillus lacus TaxID=2995335 RepID=A0ABT3X4A0_9BACL|nr:peptide chain release factor N(5)-glutamine methyltransferase [Tumebacillus lacus]MCX7569569.1 peptide chain release factor N(5)-glutamine methyltransferase [Tumebacillus lacus]